MLSLGHHRHLTRKPADLPEYPFSLQTVWLLEEVDAGHHDGGDGALLVVDDPLQRHTELLAGNPAGHGQVGRGHCLGQPEQWRLSVIRKQGGGVQTCFVFCRILSLGWVLVGRLGSCAASVQRDDSHTGSCGQTLH